MAYDEFFADRIRNFLRHLPLIFVEKRMMGGICFMVDDKMLCASHTDKDTGQNLLMARIGPEFHEQALTLPGVTPMAFTGRPMKGYVYVTDIVLDTDDKLCFWLEKCLTYHPMAKKGRKK